MAKPKNQHARLFVEYLKSEKVNTVQFAQKNNLDVDTLHALSGQEPMILIDETLFHQTTRYEKEWSLPKDGKAISLKEHINKKHKGDYTVFAQQLGESETFIKKALANNFYWVGGELFEPVPTKTNLSAFPLVAHINYVANGNAAAFSRAYGITQQQMHRWITRDCMFCDGEVYLKCTSIANESVKPAQAILLEDHISVNYGPGDDGVKAFALEHKLVPQQVKRYLSYGALWLLGDVYKNQSKFKARNITPDFTHAFTTGKHKKA